MTNNEAEANLETWSQSFSGLLESGPTLSRDDANTNGSAADIQKLIGVIQADTVKAVESMDRNENGVNEGIKRMQEVDGTFQEMITSVDLIVRETIELSAIAEQTSARSEEIVKSSATLKTLSEELTRALRQFKA